MTLEANATEKIKLRNYELIKSTTRIVIQYNVVCRDLFGGGQNSPTAFKSWFLQ